MYSIDKEQVVCAMARRIEKMWRNDVRAAEIVVRGACVGTQECASRPRHILPPPPL